MDGACRTAVPGVFAAGDVTIVPYKQIVIAAGEGAKAALSAPDYLLRLALTAWRRGRKGEDDGLFNEEVVAETKQILAGHARPGAA